MDFNDGIEKVSLAELLDVEFLQNFQDSFSKAYGVAVAIIDADGNMVASPSAAFAWWPVPAESRH